MITTKKLMILLTLIYTTNITANSEMDKFFANPENAEKFDTIVELDAFETMRNEHFPFACNQLNSIKQKKNSKQTMNCDCYVKKMNELSDKELFFMSISAYKEYEKKKTAIEAKRAGDNAEVVRLKKQSSEIKHPKMIEAEKECINK